MIHVRRAQSVRACVDAGRPHIATMITARELMDRFADRTGLVGTRPQRRYLWTDAFDVCNFVGLGARERASSLIGRPTFAASRVHAGDA